jgi:D-3-phosphoglycerate dehydrogenase
VAELDRLPALRIVATCSVGYDNIDTAAAADRGIWVCNVPDYCVEEMADSSLALLLALTRGVVALDRSVRDG